MTERIERVRHQPDYGQYASVLVQGTDEDPRPWDFLTVVMNYLPPNALVLDAGTGYSLPNLLTKCK